MPYMDDKYVVMAEETGNVQLFTITASSEEEGKAMQDFLSSCPVDLQQLIQRSPRLFAPPDRKPPQRGVRHYIHVPYEFVPAARHAYPLSGIKLEAMREQVSQLVEKGWITPSESPWAAPILFVSKEGGKSLRICVDFRDLNALTIRDRFPLPRLDLLLHKAAEAKIFSKLDLASGYHQIEVEPRHTHLTAFVLPEAVSGHALWEWSVMPFGLVNAPATFQRAMSVALRGCEDFTAVYLDDILIFSPDWETHVQHLSRVFSALEKDSYHIRLHKCVFFQEQVPFLGHILTQDGIMASENRHAALNAFQPPFCSRRQIKSFLGIVMWYRSFIPHVATLAAPLFDLTSTKKTLQWTDAATTSVRTLIVALRELPPLKRFHGEKETRVITDASTVGIGAVLEQKWGEEWRPIAFWSRKLKDAETRYSATDLEWLAVVDAVTLTWRHYLEDRPFPTSLRSCGAGAKTSQKRA